MHHKIIEYGRCNVFPEPVKTDSAESNRIYPFPVIIDIKLGFSVLKFCRDGFRKGILDKINPFLTEAVFDYICSIQICYVLGLNGILCVDGIIAAPFKSVFVNKMEIKDRI